MQMPISELVDNGANTGHPNDYDRLFANLTGMELFFNVATEDSHRAVSTPLVEAGHGLNAVLFFTSKDNPQLNRPFGGILWERALEMVSGMADADGLIVQNENGAWVAVDKAKAFSLLKELR